VGDLMIAVPPAYDVNNWCSVFNVTSLTGATQINHASGVGGPWNPAASIFPAAGYLNTSFLVNLGQFATREIGINLQGTNNTLQVRITNSASPATPTFEDLYPNIVNMKAMYAKDTNADGAVDTYDNVTPTTAAGWQQVKGIRLAIVARSEQMEKDNVTAAQPLWDLGTSGTTITVTAAAACGASKCVTLTVNTLPNWQQYRYKVYDTFVPLRNLLWQS
jgi:type IV pilus assembly protein PilW